MFCTVCGNKLAPGEKFCTNCGSAVPKLSKSDSFEVNIDYSKNAAPEAAAAQSAAAVPESSAPAKSERKKENDRGSAALVAVLVVLVLVALALLAFLVIRLFSSANASSTTVPQGGGSSVVVINNDESTPTPAPTASPAPTATPQPVPTPTPVPTPSPTPVNTQYLLPDSSSRYLTENDLKGLSWQQLCLARNEIFARHGRKFVNADIAAYFNAQSWYRGTVEAANFNESVLNDIEKANVTLIQNYENRIYGGSYY